MSNAYETKDNSGALFKNERKEKETQPDYTGTVKVNGTDLQIAAWLKKSKAGKPYMSLAFSPPYKKDAVKVAGDDDVPKGKPALDDDIPF